jgi:hypothetical protein
MTQNIHSFYPFLPLFMQIPYGFCDIRLSFDYRVYANFVFMDYYFIILLSYSEF